MGKCGYKWVVTVIFCLVSCFCTGCNGAEKNEETKEASLEFFAMDTFMRVTAYGEGAGNAVEAAKQEVCRLEELLSTGLATSEVGQLNVLGGGEVSADTWYLLKRAKELYGATEGAFDASIYPLMQAWGFADGNYRVPEAAEIAALLEKTDMQQVLLDGEGNRVTFGKEGMQIDFGGIAKGYASARIMEIYREAGIASGIISLGGNVQVLGKKPDGSLWRIGLKDPAGGDGYLGVLQVQDRAVVTSGGYERYFEQDGVRYHHILNPATGYPAESGLLSATVVSADGTLADGLSTALFVMGKERAVEFWKEHAEEFDMVLYTEEGELYVTDGIAGNFSSEKKISVVGRQE